jgi:hypothetical protein
VTGVQTCALPIYNDTAQKHGILSSASNDNNNNDNNNNSNISSQLPWEGSIPSSIIESSIIESSWPILRKIYDTEKHKHNDNDNNNNDSYFENRTYKPPKLGRRGRPYKDTWDEEEAIQEYNLPFTTVDDFSEILNCYCDNYDGSYREHMLNHLDVQIRDDLKKNPRKRNMEGRSNAFIYVKPLVPQAQHHPAAWGLNYRRSNDDFINFIESNNDTDKSKLPKEIYHYIHPACTSNTIITQSSSLANHNEDCDELNLAAEYCHRELIKQQTLNVIRLEQLKKTSIMMSKITKTRARKQMLSDILTTSMKIIDTRDEENKVKFPYLYFPSTANDTEANAGINSDSKIENGMNHSSGSNDFTPYKDNITNDERNTDSKNRYGTRASNGIRPKKVMDDDQDIDKPPIISQSHVIVGSCLLQHVPHGNFILSLKPSDDTEVLIRDNWCMGTVKKVQKDDAKLIRHVKVRPADSHPSESVWVCVDDGRLAPPGTHIKVFSKYLKRN